jgi:hypothetical protein
MVHFNRILFNNIKEYTPLWIKTVPTKYAFKPNTSQAFLEGKRQSYSKGTAAFLRLFRKYVAKIPVAFQCFMFFTSFSLTYAYFLPWLWWYQARNQHRRAELVWAKVDEIKKKRKEQEEAEEEEE